jgi:hypothetical protein
MKAKHDTVAADDLNDNESSIEPDSQEPLLESILECDECIANLDSIHVQQNKLLESTFLDELSVIGKRSVNLLKRIHSHIWLERHLLQLHRTLHIIKKKFS